MTFNLPAPDSAGVYHVREEIPVKVFFFWIKIKAHIWFNPRTRRGGFEVASG